MKIKAHFLRLSRARQIALVVSFLHLTAILGLISHHFFSRRLSPAKPMMVRMVTPPRVETKTQTAKTEKPSPPSPKPKAAKKPAPPAKKTAAVEPLHQEIAKSFDSLAKASVKSSRTPLPLP